MRAERELTLAAAFVVCLSRMCFAYNSKKFPNEGCDQDEECYSGKCVVAHPGTNARCTKLGLHKTCLYTYQCEDRLRCGTKNTCCSRYWGICNQPRDCCDPTHHCYEVEGFYYKRCLMPRSSGHRLVPGLDYLPSVWTTLIVPLVTALFPVPVR